MPQINLSITGNLYEAIGIRNREEAGKRVIDTSGTVNIPMSCYDHDSRIEDNENTGVVVPANLRLLKQQTCLNIIDVFPNFVAGSPVDPTSGGYTTMQQFSPIVAETGKYFSNFKYKWFYADRTIPSTNQVYVRSNYTCHGLLDYVAPGDPGCFTFKYTNIGLMIGATDVVFLVWVNNSSGFLGGSSNHIFALNDGTSEIYYGFYKVWDIIDNNTVSFYTYPTSIQFPNNFFNVTDDLLFESNQGFPGADSNNNQAIIYDIGAGGVNLGHYIGATGYGTDVSFNLRSYNDTMLYLNGGTTFLNDGTVAWKDQNGLATEQNVIMAFLAPIGNYLDFSVTGDFWCLGTPAGLGQYLNVGIKVNPIGMTQFFGTETLNLYENQNFFINVGGAKTLALSSKYNFKIPIRGLPIVLSKIQTDYNAADLTFGANIPGFYPLDGGKGTVNPPSISLNSIDCRRRI